MYYFTIKNIGEDEKILYYPGDISYAAFYTNLSLKIGECGEFTFTVPVSNINYSSLKEWAIVTIYRDDQEYWRGYVKEITTDFYKNAEVYCIEDLGWLNYECVKPEKGKKTKSELFQQIIDDYNNLLGIKNTEKELLCGAVYYGGETQISYEITYDDTLLSVLRQIAGTNLHLRVRRKNGKRYIDLLRLDDFVNEDVQDIQFGRNLLDYTKEMNTSYMLNVIYPYGAEIENESADIDDTPERIAGDVFVNAESIAKYGRIAKNIIFDSVKDKEKLNEQAQSYLKRNAQPRLKIEVSALDLSELGNETSKLDLGDSVHVIAEPYDIDQRIRITELEIDLQDLTKNQYTLSDSVRNNSTLTAQTMDAAEQVRALPTESELLKSAQRNAVNLLMGASGGYYNDLFEDGHRVGWQITDSMDPEDATWKWVFNSSGLGYLFKEYNEETHEWEWKTNNALTSDGQIVADRMTTGTLRAIEVDGVHIKGTTIDGSTIQSEATDGGMIYISGGTLLVNDSSKAFMRIQDKTNHNKFITIGSDHISCSNGVQFVQFSTFDAMLYLYESLLNR